VAGSPFQLAIRTKFLLARRHVCCTLKNRGRMRAQQAWFGRLLLVTQVATLF